MKFAKYTFATAGILGIIALLPQYFLLEKTGTDYPPPVTHPEFYYGFIGVALAFQIAFLIIATDPVRYRPLMIAAVVEKLSFGLSTVILYLQNRTAGLVVAGASLDLVLAVLFVISYIKTSVETPSDFVNEFEH